MNIKTNLDGSKIAIFQGVTIYANPYGHILYCTDWNIVDELVKRGFATKKVYTALCGHTEYTLNA